MDETSNTAFIDPRRCPICGSENNCGVAQGRGTCWCFSNPIPDHVIAQVPAEVGDQACVCQRCASGDRNPDAILQRAKEILKRRNGG